MTMEISLHSKLIIPIAIFFLGLLCRAIFSFLETSITALRLFKLKEIAHAHSKYQSLLHTLEQNPHRVLITILIANSLADVTTAAVATYIADIVFSYFNLSTSMGFSMGIGFASIAIIIFGEILPKNLAKARGEQLFPSMLWLINLIFYTLYPLVSVLMRFTDGIMYRLGGAQSSESSEWVSSEKEIRFLIDYIHEKGLIELEKTEMLQNIFKLGGTPVKEIMIPAIDIISVSVDRSLPDVLEVFSKHRYTRLPVYKDKIDNIIGMIHQKDVFVLLYKNEQKSLKDFVRPIMFVPESLKINQLLRQFRRQHMHIAIVLNEHGIVTGLITLEDILEEIVGDIVDEHEAIASKITSLKDGSWLAQATISLEDLSQVLRLPFKSSDSVTLGGFMAEKLQHLPKKGERLIYENYCFQVQKASKRRVQEVLIIERKNLIGNKK